MVVKNLKCPQCGGIKINKLTTSFIYCDYCSTLMGYDMKMMQDEAKEVFSVTNFSKPKQKEYIALTQSMAKALNDENVNDFVNSQVRIREAEFDLFPKRFSPKTKQKAYREKYLLYEKAYWTEQLQNNYFKKSKEFRDKINPVAGKLSTQTVGSKVVYEFNDVFKEYLNILDEYIKDSIKETLKMKCMELYPENSSPTFDVFYKQGIDSSLQMFDSDTIEKAIKHLGLESEYITIEDINFSEYECIVCKTKLNVPSDSKSMVCETCGNVNNFEEKTIQCLSCGAPVSFSNNNTCEYCGAVHMSFENKPKTQEKLKKTKTKKGGFFNKLFGS